MSCSNREKVSIWFDTLKERDVMIRRYHRAPVKLIPKGNCWQWMEGHLDQWLVKGDSHTFWHLKQLIKHFQKQDSIIPVVITCLKGQMLVDPGLSRLAVYDYLKKDHIGVDVVYPKALIQNTDFLGDFTDINTVDQLLSPYDSTGIGYRLDTCHDSPCQTCIDNKVIHNGDYRYSPEWDKKWFYEKEFEEWLKLNRNNTVKEKMDWYNL